LKAAHTAVDILKDAGIPFPEGSSAVFSTANGVGLLVVTNLPESLDLVEAFTSSITHCRGAMISASVHIVQADAKLLRDLVAKAGKNSDHADVLKALEEAVTRGEAKFVSSGWLETRSGQRTALESGIQYMVASPPRLDVPRPPKSAPPAPANAAPERATVEGGVAAALLPKGLTAKHKSTRVGLSFEVDPVIGPDGVMVDVGFDLDYHYAPPQMRKESRPSDALRAGLSMVDFHEGKVTTAITMRSGTTRLVGLWKPEGTPEFEKGDLLQAAFLRVDVVRVDGPPTK
jgi:hypothetical protein